MRRCLYYSFERCNQSKWHILVATINVMNYLKYVGTRVFTFSSIDTYIHTKYYLMRWF